jgi:16S rRNA (guanine1207-N2)-methyltransferase
MNPALEALIFALREHPLPPGNVCFLGAEPHPDLPKSTACQPLKPLATLCENEGIHLVPEPSGKFDTVLFLPGKSKEEILTGFALAHDLLKPNGCLITSMPNTAGASRFEKELRTATEISYSVSKNKCRVFCARKSNPWNANLLDEWRALSTPTLIEGTNFQTIPGVFSQKKIDPGSALLAAHLPPSLRGHIADLGAGWGFLSQTALEKSPGITLIDLFESDSRALQCARINVPAKATFHWHDVTQGLPQNYDHILINPPFHTGQSKDLDLGKAFLTVASKALKRGGTIYLVANRQLPYEAHLQSLNLRSRLITENHTYKIITAS